VLFHIRKLNAKYLLTFAATDNALGCVTNTLVLQPWTNGRRRCKNERDISPLPVSLVCSRLLHTLPLLYLHLSDPMWRSQLQYRERGGGGWNEHAAHLTTDPSRDCLILCMFENSWVMESRDLCLSPFHYIYRPSFFYVAGAKVATSDVIFTNGKYRSAADVTVVMSCVTQSSQGRLRMGSHSRTLSLSLSLSLSELAGRISCQLSSYSSSV
jgi:hypothetical protein